MYSTILNNISKYVTLDAQEELLFTGMLTFKSIPKKTIVLKAGDICDFNAYIQKGCIRIFYIDDNGYEVTLSFATQDCWVSDVSSFYERIPSLFSIETLEETDIYFLSSHAKEEICKSIPKLEGVFYNQIIQNLSSIQKRLVKIFTTTATERYEEFISVYPSILRRIPLYYIASYLGITQAFLSKIRKNFTRKGSMK
ncbi:Crp/Fnr family transcriptional regulator [Sphingobacterium prati]|uniref:Crp/Fnr family transcriptional regulator n=1 Tax=Sphingobacterium prati TaxID=2737006 RepID=UPI001556B1C4|nr:Crp/Fnr family transcriptional regulator [Sphingobacterium prati]NPE45474.1 Crp/Fnr family transcriptional regulator [Sphingobacterium prati]